MMRVAVVGLGHIGLTMAVCFAKQNLNTTGVDSDKNRIDQIERGSPPFYEPGLEDMLRQTLRSEKLTVTGDHSRAVVDSDITFVTVETPSDQDGFADLTHLRSASLQIGRALKEAKDYKLVVPRSTVPPTTTEGHLIRYLQESSAKQCGADFGVCYNPEFLREGSAVRDVLNPDRLVIGEYNKRSGDALERFYRVFHSERMPPVIRTTLANAELIKYASNAFIGVKISFINEIARLCMKTPGADVQVVAKGMGLDPRIGSSFLGAGLGWGGSCLPKDLSAMTRYARQNGLELSIIESAIAVNKTQPLIAVEQARRRLGSLSGRGIAVLGLAFKPDTDDIRESVSIRIAQKLLQEGAKVKVYDPKAAENARRILGDQVTYADSAAHAIGDSECCIVATEWGEFSELTCEEFVKLMKRPLVIDGRRVLNATSLEDKVELVLIGKYSA
jgi:UDPglucose 6-dehydrogenase